MRWPAGVGCILVGIAIDQFFFAHVQVTFVGPECNCKSLVAPGSTNCAAAERAVAESAVALQNSQERFVLATQRHEKVVQALKTQLRAGEKSHDETKKLLAAMKRLSPSLTWIQALRDVSNSTVSNMAAQPAKQALALHPNGGADDGSFDGVWQECSEEEWRSLLRHRGCREPGYNTKVQCCEPQFFKNFTTPLRPLRFVSSHPFLTYKLEGLLSGGIITFIGDSVTSQIYDALRARMVRDKLQVQPCPLRTLATACSQLVRERDGAPSTAFTMELYRADKAANATLLVDAALFDSPLPVGLAGIQRGVVEHAVVANIGLHFSDSKADETELFTQQVNHLAAALQKFNEKPGSFGFLRDITPQHFQALTSAGVGDGDYMRRDRSVNHCAPWSEGLLSSRNTVHNQILLDAAAAHGVVVQRTVTFLKERYDAHIETRDDSKRNVLDCTHWCAPVFDVFDDTLLYILAQYKPD